MLASRARRGPRPSSRSIRASMPSTAIRAARPRCSSKPKVGHAPGCGGRPLERQVVAEVERQLRLDRHLDRRPGDLAVALRRVAVPRGEERAVDRDRRKSVVPATSSLQSMFPRSARRQRSSGLPAQRRHADHAEERRELDVAPAVPAPPVRELQSHRGAPRRQRHAAVPGRDLVDPDSERLARAGAAHHDGPASAWPVSSSARDARTSRRRRSRQPAFGHREARPSRRASTVEHRLEVTREVPVEVAASSGSSWKATRTRAGATRRPRRARPTACRRPRSASTGTGRRSR